MAKNEKFRETASRVLEAVGINIIPGTTNNTTPTYVHIKFINAAHIIICPFASTLSMLFLASAFLFSITSDDKSTTPDETSGRKTA